MKKLVLLGLLFTLLGCQHGMTLNESDDNNGLDVDGVEISGVNDPLEAKASISTHEFSRPIILISGEADWFYRGHIDKKTDIADYQLYVRFNSSQWMYWDHAKYLTLDGLKELPVVRVGSDLDCSPYGCAHYEDVIMDLDRSTLNNWRSKEDKTTIRFASTKVSGSNDIEIDPEETAKFLQAMDNVTSYLKKPMPMK